MQIEVIRRFRQIKCRILRHDTIYTDITAHFYQRQYGIDYYIKPYGINHGIVRTIGGGYKLRRADFGRRISVVRSHPAGYFQFGRKHIDDVNLPQAEQFTQLDEAQSYRTGTYHYHFLSRSQVEILESAQHFTPGAGDHRFFRLHMSRNRVLNLKAVPASLFGGSQSFFFQYLEIVHHYIFAETAPATVNSLRAKVGDQTADSPVAYFKVAYFLAYGHYNSCILVSQSQRISIYSGKMSRNQLAVGRITQCHHFCFHQRLISIDGRSFDLSYFYFAGSRHNYRFHRILIHFYRL